jgi:hypothetical protein
LTQEVERKNQYQNSPQFYSSIDENEAALVKSAHKQEPSFISSQSEIKAQKSFDNSPQNNQVKPQNVQAEPKNSGRDD